MLTLLLPMSGVGQNHNSRRNNWGRYAETQGIFVGVGANIVNMDGDYGSKQLGVFTGSYSLFAEKKIGAHFIPRVSYTKGNLAQRFIGRFQRYDFQSSISTLDVSGMYLLPPLTGCNARIQLRPFVRLGIGMISFDSYANWYDDLGRNYHFWRDGTVRLVAESEGGDKEAPVVKRDQHYETSIDSLNLYAKRAVTFPGEIGLRMKVSPTVGFYFSAGYTLSTSDYIDHSVAYNDRYLTDRARQNRFPDGFFNYSVAMIYQIQWDLPDKRYRKYSRRPMKCRKF